MADLMVVEKVDVWAPRWVVSTVVSMVESWEKTKVEWKAD